MKNPTTRIPLHTLVAWLDDASEYISRENDPAMRAIDCIKLRLIQYLHGKDFETGYLYEHVDDAIDALRRPKKRTPVAHVGWIENKQAGAR